MAFRSCVSSVSSARFVSLGFGVFAFGSVRFFAIGSSSLRRGLLRRWRRVDENVARVARVRLRRIRRAREVLRRPRRLVLAEQPDRRVVVVLVLGHASPFITGATPQLSLSWKGTDSGSL